MTRVPKAEKGADETAYGDACECHATTRLAGESAAQTRWRRRITHLVDVVLREAYDLAEDELLAWQLTVRSGRVLTGFSCGTSDVDWATVLRNAARLIEEEGTGVVEASGRIT